MRLSHCFGQTGGESDALRVEQENNPTAVRHHSSWMPGVLPLRAASPDGRAWMIHCTSVSLKFGLGWEETRRG